MSNDDNDRELRDALAVVLEPHTDDNIIDAFLEDVIDSVIKAGWRPAEPPRPEDFWELSDYYAAYDRWLNEGGAR